MMVTSLNKPRWLKIPCMLIFISACLHLSCTRSEKQSTAGQFNITPSSTQWYRQAVVDLGYRVSMFSPDEGIAISRGIGKEVKGRAYRFRNGQWLPFFEYEYSDYPLIAQIDSANIWTVTHLTHEGAYRPIVSEFKNGRRREIPLPKIMWDGIDHVMFKGLHRFKNGTAWMVGQQGHILFYDGKKWNEAASPLLDPDRASMFQGDLNDIAMTSDQTGWSVGRDGIIIRCEKGRWEKVESPTNQTLLKISMVDDSTGWAAGNNGTILECKNYSWRKVTTEFREQLSSVFALNNDEAWIVGNNTTLLAYDGNRWHQDESIKNYDDILSDISVVKDSSGNNHIWLIGSRGIYTNSQSLGFSFTDITDQAGLRRVGKFGLFFNRSNKEMPDLLVANDGGSSLLFENTGDNLFADITSETALLSSPRDASVIAAGDINNDGEEDVLQCIDQSNFKLYLGTAFGGFRDFTVRSGLVFDEINPLVPCAARFVDLDNDGNLDLYLSCYDLPDQLFAGDGTGRFTKVIRKTGIDKILNHASYGPAFADFNNDGLTDIFIPYYVSYRKKFFDLFLNKGGMHFESKDDSLFYSPVDLSPTAITASDFNNDGNVDLYIHSQKLPPLLFINDGNAKFTNRSALAGFTSIYQHPEPINGIVGSADVNNDGWMDLFDGSKLFLNSPGGKFTEVSERIGIQFVGTPSFADIDNDGDQDLFIGSSRGSLGKGDRAALFRNNLNKKNYIKVQVEGDISNRTAIGAMVRIEDTKGNIQVRTIGDGGSQMAAQNLSVVCFGVDEDQSYSVRVDFPSGAVSHTDEVYAGSIVEIDESNLLRRQFTLAVLSVQRTILLTSWSGAVQKIIILAGVILLYILSGKYFGAEKFVMKWYSVAGLVLIFAIIVHLSVYESEFVSTAAALLSSSFVSALSIAVARVVIRQREAQHVSHYKITELIGAGGMGKVYKAVDTNTKQIVALKVLNQELLKDPENRKRLSAEGHLLSSFDHPNIVKVFEIGESNERGFIAMEFLNGGTLREKLEKEHPLSIEQIKLYVLQVCDGLSEVHSKGIIHRDLKTGNLMLDANGAIRIMDFGLSKSPLVTTMTSLGTVLGTLGYVAPEQVTSMNADHRTDIFSLGVIMYELLTKELPFKGENEIALIHSIFNTVPPPPSQVRNDIPKQWDDIVMKCLAKDQNERFSSAEEVKQKLEHIGI